MIRIAVSWCMIRAAASATSTISLSEGLVERQAAQQLPSTDAAGCVSSVVPDTDARSALRESAWARQRNSTTLFRYPRMAETMISIHKLRAGIATGENLLRRLDARSFEAHAWELAPVPIMKGPLMIRNTVYQNMIEIRGMCREHGTFTHLCECNGLIFLAHSRIGHVLRTFTQNPG